MANLSSADESATRRVVELPFTLSNRDFLEGYARPGCVGLVSGTTFIDRVIARAERHVDQQKAWGRWTHAFVFSERRSDKHLWVVESDLQIYRKHIQLGVQENRSSKYFDASLYSSLAVLDFGLNEDATRRLATEALELVASRARYSLRELIGTLIALPRPELRERSNLLAREHCFYCSALVQYLFRRLGIDLTPGLDVKNTTPEDISRSPLPHTAYLLQRAVPQSQFRHVAAQLKRRVRARMRAVHRRKTRRRRAANGRE
jgi:hypothetical protein